MMNDRPEPQSVGLFIDGQSASSTGDEWIETRDPWTGQLSVRVPHGSGADVDTAVSSARRAFESTGWSTTPSMRKNALAEFAHSVAAEAATLDLLDATEMGKPVSVAYANAAAAAALTKFCAESVDNVTGDVYQSDPLSLVVQRRVPRGVVGAVVPWNFPTFNALLKVAPALAVGNTVVLKP